MDSKIYWTFLTASLYRLHVKFLTRSVAGLSPEHGYIIYGEMKTKNSSSTNGKGNYSSIC